MNAYKYDITTGEFLLTVQCQESPREPGKFLIPANTTIVEPPEEQNGKVRIWNGTEWIYEIDNRGKTIYSINDSRQTSIMENIFESEVPNGYTLISPPDTEYKYTFENNMWLPQDIEELREQLKNQLWSNYKSFQRSYVDPEDLTLANTCAERGSEKGLAVQNWVLALWAKYYEVKDMISSANTLEELRTIDISTNTLTQPPYTIRELNDEAVIALAKNFTN